MNSAKPLIKLGARLTNNNYMYRLSIDKGVKGPNKAIFNTVLDNLIALLLYCFRLNQIGEKIDCFFYCLK